MTTEIIHTGRAGPDKARQGRKEPGRDGKGRTGPDSARQVQAGSGSAEQCWTAPNRTEMRRVMKGRSLPDGAGKDLDGRQNRTGAEGQCKAVQGQAG